MRRNKRHPLFITYSYQGLYGWGMGNNTSYFATFRKHISTKDIRDIESDLCEKYGYKSVVLQSYKFI